MASFPNNQDAFERYPSTFESPFDFVPHRVVSLVPSLTESLFDLALGDRLVAVTDNCVHPADQVQSLVSVGHPQQPDSDAIIDLQPELVLFNRDENPVDTAESLQMADIPVWITGPRTVFDALNVLWHLMYIFDNALMVPRVREIERAFDYTSAAACAQTPVPVFAALPSADWLAMNADTFAHDMLKICGGANICADLPTQYEHVALADIEAGQPQVVLLPDSIAADAADAVRALDIPAVHQQRIHLIDSTLLMWHGTRIAFALRDLPGLIMDHS